MREGAESWPFPQSSRWQRRGCSGQAASPAAASPADPLPGCSPETGARPRPSSASPLRTSPSPAVLCSVTTGVPGPQPPSQPHLCTQRVARAHAQSRKGAAFPRGRRAASASSPSRRLCGSQPPVTPALPRGPSWPCSSAADAAPDAPLRSFIFKMSLNYLNAQHTRSRETSNTGITEIVPHFIFSHNDCHPVP